MVAVSTKAAGTIQITKTTLAQPYIGVTPLISGSGNVANAEAKATLTGTPPNVVYLCGLIVTGAGAATPKAVLVTVDGLLGGTRSFVYAFADDPKKANQTLALSFDPPLPAADVSTPIVVTCPASGTGGVNNMVFLHGFHSTSSVTSVIAQQLPAGET